MKGKKKQVSKAKHKKVSKKKHMKHMRKHFPTLEITDEKKIAMDFATKVYKKFDKMIKSIILFGSTVKHSSIATSDIDIILIIDDVSIKWDEELITWYRSELSKLMELNPYEKELHVNTTKLSTWWDDLMKGDPVVINILRYGEELIDFGGFFSPLKVLLQQGKIRSTAEAVYNALNRAPYHLDRSRSAALNSIEGLYWAMVDSAHALLMAAKQVPPSPEHVPIMMKEIFVDKGLLKMKYVTMYRDLYVLHRKIVHGDILNIEGAEIDKWKTLSEEFLDVMTGLIRDIIENTK